MADSSNADEVANALAKLAPTVYAALEHVVVVSTANLLADVQRRASRARTLPSVAGLPPRLQTGNYNGSIGMKIKNQVTQLSGSVGTNAIQGMRLELGYDNGTKRTWPHPHFGPSLAVAEPKFIADIEAAMGRVQS